MAILVVGETMVCAHGRHGWAGSGLAPWGESGLIIKIRRVVHSSLSTARKTDRQEVNTFDQYTRPQVHMFCLSSVLCIREAIHELPSVLGCMTGLSTLQVYLHMYICNV